MNLEQLRSRCAFRYRDPSAILVDDDRWNEHINAAYREFLSITNYPALVTRTILDFSPGDRLLPITDGLDGNLVLGVLTVRDLTNGTALEQLDGYDRLADEETEEGDDTALGVPGRYAVVGSDLLLFPAPDSDVSIEILHRSPPAALTLDTDVPSIPVTYHEALVWGAIATAAWDDENERAQDWQNRFREMCERAKQEWARNKHTHYPVLRRAPYPTGSGWR